MKLLTTHILLCVLLLCFSYSEAKDLVVGTRINNLLVSTEKVVFKGIPLIRRDKDYTYTDPKKRIIKVRGGVYNIDQIILHNDDIGVFM